MSDTLHSRPTVPLADALAALAARGVITEEQRLAILAEVGAPTLPPAPAAGQPPTRRSRTLAEVLVEVGLYVGSALVLAAAVALVAQNWEGLAHLTQITILAATALVTALVGWALARGSIVGSARRRVAGVVLVGTALSAAGTVALVLGDEEWTGVVALATALAVLVAAQVLAASAVTEIGMFVAAWALLQVTGEWLRPQVQPTPDEWGNDLYEATTFDRLMPLGGVVLGLLWALLVSRRLMHRELAVALGVLAAFGSAMPMAGTQESRVIGLVALGVVAAVGFWRFIAEGFWPWLAGAIASVTAFVFWAVGGDQQPALAFLVAGLVLLASSALGWQVARRRRAARHGTTSPPAP